MLDFVKKIVPAGVLRAWVMKTVRGLAGVASAAIVTYLVSHHASPDDATTIASAVAALIMGGASYAFSLWDASAVDKKIQAAALTGTVPASASNAKAMIAAVQAGVAAQAARQAQDASTVADGINKVAAAPALSNAEALARLTDHTA